MHSDKKEKKEKKEKKDKGMVRLPSHQCSCGKQYRSASALYTHNRNKHQGQRQPNSGVILKDPNGARPSVGRPKKSQSDMKVDISPELNRHMQEQTCLDLQLVSLQEWVGNNMQLFTPTSQLEASVEERCEQLKGEALEALAKEEGVETGVEALLQAVRQSKDYTYKQLYHTSSLDYVLGYLLRRLHNRLSSPAFLNLFVLLLAFRHAINTHHNLCTCMVTIEYQAQVHTGRHFEEMISTHTCFWNSLSEVLSRATPTLLLLQAISTQQIRLRSLFQDFFSQWLMAGKFL